MNKGIIQSGLGHLYYICPDCGHWQAPSGAHQHKDGTWIEGSWLQEFYQQDKKSVMDRWSKVDENPR